MPQERLTKEVAYDYLNKHNIQGILCNITSSLILHRPEDPIHFIISELERVREIHQNEKNALKLTAEQARRLKVVIFLGAPAAGKTTQAQALAGAIDAEYVHINTLIDNAISPQSDSISAARAAGQPIPDHVMITLLERHFASNPEKVYCLDGFPSTIEQASAFDTSINSPVAAIQLELGEDGEVEIMRRMPYKDPEGRDVELKSVVGRLSKMEEVVMPIVRYYETQTLLHTVGRMGVEETTGHLVEHWDTAARERETRVEQEIARLKE
eukprot:gnl/Dysnectes_brevis/121_a143_7645.p2 GENE.gnl/Dysnectes_brevis/121_a143_7645~~gnl/Dysnectes_brevis/121_a143_7645.p2  ORF type:complete len:269 (+),score=122.93 gnl/Dysnectes_brevis/121_a143_7645:105-911(+)